MAILPPPTTLPTWAVQDVVDPVSGQNNVLTPPDQNQQFGWNFGIFPPRNWFNWLSRWTYNWLAYLKQNDSKARTVVTFCSTNGGDSDGPIVSVPLTALRPIVMIYINDSASGNANTFYVGMYNLSNTSSLTPNTIANNDITVGSVDKNTGILQNISSSASTPGPFNIVAVQYDSFF